MISLNVLGQVTVTPFLHLAKWDEPEGKAVYAETGAVWGVRVSVEDMPQMRVSCSAPYLCPSHPERIIVQIDYCVGVDGL